MPLQTDPFGVYIHWPFCAQKCPYCDFNSHVRHGGWNEARFLKAYKRELDHVAERLAGLLPSPSWGGAGGGGTRQADGRDGTAGVFTPPPGSSPGQALTPPHQGEGNSSPAAGRTRTVSSIFFGGGTPSLMKPETVAAILEHVGTLWPIAAEAEITLEANPGSVEAGRFAGYRAAGVNRVSLGLQSLRDEQLKRLGRIHTVAEAKAALDIARRTFDRFSFDLIYARPGQTPQDWRAELAEALEMAGKHLSLYQLTIEPDTPYEKLFKAGKLVVPDGDAALQLYEITQEMTEARGLPAYEISNHAAPGEESRHNLLYWRYGEYAGIGPGAHGRLVYGGARHATSTERNPEAWAALTEAQGHGLVDDTRLAAAEEADEMLLMGLRLGEGLDLEALAGVSGRRPSMAVVDELTTLGLLETCEVDVGRVGLRRNPPSGGPSEGGGLRLAPNPPYDTAYDRADDTKEGGGLRLVPNPPYDPAEDFASIRACAGPGLPLPALSRRIRATRAGRLVLNQLVYRLSASMG